MACAAGSLCARANRTEPSGVTQGQPSRVASIKSNEATLTLYIEKTENKSTVLLPYSKPNYTLLRVCVTIDGVSVGESIY
jgi:hypothetical protein